MIRVNSVHPTGVDTEMIQNEATFELFMPDPRRETPAREAAEASATHERLPIPWVEPRDISNAVLWLASATRPLRYRRDAARRRRPH